MVPGLCGAGGETQHLCIEGEPYQLSHSQTLLRVCSLLALHMAPVCHFVSF